MSTFRVVAAAEEPGEPTVPGEPQQPTCTGCRHPAGCGGAGGAGSPETLAATGADPRVGLWMALALLLAGLAGARLARRRLR